MTTSAVTATGPVSRGELGRTLLHEHVLSLVPGGWLTGTASDDRSGLARTALAALPGAGIATVVDLTTRASTPGRAAALRRLSQQTDVGIVVGAGFYKSGHLPDWVAAATVDALADWYERAAVDGLDGTEVRAGCFGELGTSLGYMTAAEARNLRAAARAHRRTGVPISTHCTLGTMGREQVELLDAERVDLSRVVVGHQDLAESSRAVIEVLETGANVGLDTLGKEWFDLAVDAPGPRSSAPGGGLRPPHAHTLKWTCHRRDTARMDLLIDLLDRGYEAQLVLSTDLLGRELHANATTHGRHGYRYLPEVVLPELRRRGVDEATLDVLLVENPARILALPSAGAAAGGRTATDDASYEQVDR